MNTDEPFPMLILLKLLSCRPQFPYYQCVMQLRCCILHRSVCYY